MDKKKNLIVIVLVLVLVIAGASVLYNQLGAELAPEQLAVAETTPPAETQTGTEPPKIPAPDVTVYDREGNAVKLSDYFGKPIVMNFWASWCGPCKMEMPDFNEKSQELEGKVQFLMVNMTDGARETVEIASDFIAEQGYTFRCFSTPPRKRPIPTVRILCLRHSSLMRRVTPLPKPPVPSAAKPCSGALI